MSLVVHAKDFNFRWA